MTEQDSTPADFNLDDWINGGSVARRSIDIYSRPDLYADYEELERRLAIALKREGLDESSLADAEDEEIVEIRDAIEENYNAWLASKSTWRVRALDEEEEIAPLRDAIPRYDDLPTFGEKKPTAPRDHAGKPSEAYEKRLDAWQERFAAFLKEQEPAAKDLAAKRAKSIEDFHLACVAAAVESIEFPNGHVEDGVTVAHLRTMQKKIGTHQVSRLVAAAMQASGEEPDLPVPFSPTSSKGDQG